MSIPQSILNIAQHLVDEGCWPQSLYDALVEQGTGGSLDILHSMYESMTDLERETAKELTRHILPASIPSDFEGAVLQSLVDRNVLLRTQVGEDVYWSMHPWVHRFLERRQVAPTVWREGGGDVRKILPSDWQKADEYPVLVYRSDVDRMFHAKCEDLDLASDPCYDPNEALDNLRLKIALQTAEEREGSS